MHSHKRNSSTYIWEPVCLPRGVNYKVNYYTLFNYTKRKKKSIFVKMIKNGQRTWIKFFPKANTQMDNRYVKRCSTSLITRECRSKTMSCPRGPGEWLQPERQVWVSRWGKGTLTHCGRERKLAQPLWKTVWRFLKKLKIERLHDPAIPRLGVQRKLNPYLRESSAPPCSLQRTHNCRDPERQT